MVFVMLVLAVISLIFGIAVWQPEFMWSKDHESVVKAQMIKAQKKNWAKVFTGLMIAGMVFGLIGLPETNIAPFEIMWAIYTSCIFSSLAIVLGVIGLRFELAAASRISNRHECCGRCSRY